MEMIERACPLCGSEDHSCVFAESNVDFERLDAFAFASRKVPEYMHHRLVTCRRCDLLYASPVPGADALAAAYDQAAFDSGEEARLAARTYARYLPWIAPQLPDLDSALDIGTGDGAFLEELLSAGFANPIGIEPSSAPIAAAKEHIRRLIRHEVFRPGRLEAERYSLVSCFQTIEHLNDPSGTCAEAFRLLKPGGAIFLVGHNRRALSAKLLGRKSPIFDIEHLQLFSKRSAELLLERAGFTQVRIWPIVNRYPLHYWLKLFPLPRRLKAKVLGLMKESIAGRLLIPLPAGNLGAIGMKPGGSCKTLER